LLSFDFCGLSPDECNGILVCQNYLEDLKNKTNEVFIAAFHKLCVPKTLILT